MRATSGAARRRETSIRWDEERRRCEVCGAGLAIGRPNAPPVCADHVQVMPYVAALMLELEQRARLARARERRARLRSEAARARARERERARRTRARRGAA